MIANVLSVAGSDPSGGAGIQADLKAFAAQGVYGMAALTALTAQNTRGVSGVWMVPPEFVREQIAVVLADVRVDAVKIGMIGTADDGVAAVRDRLVPLAHVVTPNLGEAAALTGAETARDREGIAAAARALIGLGAAAALVKGGHLDGSDSPDLLASDGGEVWLEGARVATRNSHGTGCTLSAALAARLGRGEDLETAARAAKAYVAGALAAADRLDVGSGHGPTHHFHALWTA